MLTSHRQLFIEMTQELFTHNNNLQTDKGKVIKEILLRHLIIYNIDTFLESSNKNSKDIYLYLHHISGK